MSIPSSWDRRGLERSGFAGFLRFALRQYRRTGEGRADNHVGGVWIWQLADADPLLVAWRVAADQSDQAVDDEETALLSRFRADHGRRPFANRSM